MEKFILQKDVKVQEHKYRLAVLEEQLKYGGFCYFSIFAEMFEEETFELIHVNRFVTKKEALDDLNDLINYLVNVKV